MIGDERSRKIALIGGSGFIGSGLAKVLTAQGHTVRILDIAKPPADSAAEYRYGDVTDRAHLVQTMEGSDLIVNLAAAHRDDVQPASLYHDVNVTGAENVCAAAAALGIAEIVFTSSVAIYGFSKGEPDEDSPPNPFNLYGKTKWEAECVYRAWQAEDADGRGLQIVRPTVVFGPGNRGNVYNLMAQLAKPLFIMVGAGKNRKSLAFMGNVAAFLSFLVAESGKGKVQVYNYCDRPISDMNDLLRIVRKTLGRSEKPDMRLPYAVGIAIGTLFDAAARATGRTFPISKARIEKFCANSVFAADRAHGGRFKAPYGLEEAFRQTIMHEFPVTGEVPPAVPQERPRLF